MSVERNVASLIALKEHFYYCNDSNLDADGLQWHFWSGSLSVEFSFSPFPFLFLWNTNFISSHCLVAALLWIFLLVCWYIGSFLRRKVTFSYTLFCMQQQSPYFERILHFDGQLQLSLKFCELDPLTQMQRDACCVFNGFFLHLDIRHPDLLRLVRFAESRGLYAFFLLCQWKMDSFTRFKTDLAGSSRSQ